MPDNQRDAGPVSRRKLSAKSKPSTRVVSIVITASVFVGVSLLLGARFAGAGSALQGSLLVVLLFAASYTDIKKRIIPDTVCMLIALTNFICFAPVNLLGIFSALPFLLAAYLCDGFGGGDIKLMAASGMVLGFTGGIAAMMIALSAELIFYLLYCAFQKSKGRECMKSMPLAPFLTVGVLAVYFVNIGGFHL